MKEIKDPIFFLERVLLSIYIALLSLGIGYFLVDTLKNQLCRKGLILVVYIVAIGIFIGMLKLTSLKRFHTIKNFYLLSAGMALTIEVIVIRMFLLIFNKEIIRIAEQISFENTVSEIAIFLSACGFIGLVCVLFLIIFNLITKYKSNYIQYLSDQVKNRSIENMNVPMHEKGDDELTQLCRTINQMNDTIQQSLREKEQIEKQRNELISNVSHDLRSPLTSIIGYVDLLKRNGCKDEENFCEYIEVIDRRLNGLNRLVNELFELTKIESPSFVMDHIHADITPFLKQFAYENQILLSKHGLNLKYKIDNGAFIMDIDFERMARVFQNLFSNTMKYAVKGHENMQEVDVWFESKVEDKCIIIRLINYVSEQCELDTDNMFQRFYKGDYARTDSNSAGLGLAVAKRIVELHGGEIIATLEDRKLEIRICFRNNTFK